MRTRESRLNRISRRDVLLGSVALATAGIVAGPRGVCAKTEAASTAATPPLPWQWVKLDPAEAGRRAYHLYFDKGGCGTASYLSILSMLQEQVGHPWTSLPDMMMIHAAGGYGAHGTLCGALGGASCIINLATYSPDDDFYKAMIDWLYAWYAEQEFPTGRFDDISKMPNQVRVKAKSPLCHTSVTSWTLAANEEVNSAAKKERCAKVSGEVVYTVVDRLNEHFAGGWAPPAWQPSAETAHCVKCHGPDTTTASKAGLDHQQGHMEYLMCHEAHPTWN